MFKKLLSILVVVFGYYSVATAQVGQGALKGKVTDKQTGETLPFVNIVLERGGSQVTGVSTDFDGMYTIRSLQPGEYTLKASFVGYQAVEVAGLRITADKTTPYDIQMSSGVDLGPVDIIHYEVPLIEKDGGTSGATVTRDEISKMAGRSATSVAQTVGGVMSKDDGSGNLNFRGGRSGDNYYFIDGVKVRGSSSVPQTAIEQVSVLTGGIPAKYGDITGGIISITTRGGTSKITGGMEYLTSGFKSGDRAYGLDAFGYNLLEFSLLGPLVMKKDTAGKKTSPLVGFFISGNLNSTADPRPSHLGFWKVKDEVLEDLMNNPLRYATFGDQTFQNAEFLRLNDLEKTKTNLNVARKGVNLIGKLDLYATKKISLTLGGSMDFNTRHEGSLSYSLMNSHHNPEVRRQTWRVFSRLTHRLGSENPDEEEKSASNIKNAFYSIQVDFEKYRYRRWDDEHKDDLFKYGHVGKFQRHMDREYRFGTYVANGDTLQGVVQETFRDTLLSFTPSEHNPLAGKITQNYYELYGWQGFDAEGNPVYDYEAAQNPDFPNEPNYYFRNTTNISSGGALLNGSAPRNIYDMYRSPALRFNDYSLIDQEQYRISAIGSADIKDHAISVGFEIEQRVDRNFTASPIGLWQQGRLLTNRHIEGQDLSKPDTAALAGNYAVINYPRLHDGNQSYFDYNLRNKLGLDPDGLDFIDFDSYDPETFDLGYFSADELLRNGGTSSLVNYYGFDHHGNIQRGENPTVTDFFTKRDEFGNFERPVGAFRPTYIAGYIEDNFDFEDLVFRVGIRVDRFDANQKVLKDPYVFFPTVSPFEDEALGLVEGGAHPSNITENHVVYVDDIQQPTKIMGYRQGHIWYNAEGSEISDPSPISGGGAVSPLLQDKSKTNSQDITDNAFTDYTPQTNFMPRIAFAFPISDEAQFTAHYDVLTQRPSGRNRLDLMGYYFLTNTSLNNPALKPSKTIDFEVGFQQKLTIASALKLSAFYREQRDQITMISMQGTFPGAGSYRTFGNIDFGTVKGMTIDYDLRRTGNVRVRASYTLQFAEGTGSDELTQSNLIRAGQDNLRSTFPYNFDQRHVIITNVDYRFGSGKGPVWFKKPVFENSGLNLIFNAGSGEPYSKQTGVSSQALFSGTGQSVLHGSINGARLPWQFRMDATADKSFKVTFGKGEDENKKELDMNIYLQVFNVLNNMNTVNVYNVTGNPDDDGFLAAAEFEPFIAGQTNETSFRELYNIRVNNPFMFNLPRRIQLGVIVNF